MERKKQHFLVHTKYFKAIKDWEDAKIGKLFRALHAYHDNGEMPDFDTDMMMAFEFYRNAVDDDTAKYNEKCEQNRINAYIRWKKDQKDE